MTNTKTANRTVVGLFDSMEDANRAADQLRTAGIDSSNISVVAGNESNRYADYVTSEDKTKDAASRAGTGAAIGGGLGLVAGLVALAIPGFGPVIAAGPIAAALTGAAAGAATGGLIGGLTSAGVSESDARLYERRLQEGGVLLTVRTNSDMSDEVSDIMDNNGARDVDEEKTGSSTVTGRDYTHTGTTTDRVMNQGEKAIPVVEERVDVGKRNVGRRAVRVYGQVEETPVEREIELREETIHVERRPADRPATEADFGAFREGSIELTEMREEPVVRKEARVVEEVVVGKDVNTRRETVRDTERRTDVRVEETGAKGDAGYTFGSTWANDPRYRDRDWSSVEPELRRDWETRGHGAWEDFKDSVQRGWDKVRGRR